MKKAIIVCIIVFNTLFLFAQEAKEEQKWKFGVRCYTIFIQPLSDYYNVRDFKGDLGYGVDVITSRTIIANKLLLNMGINFENYKYGFFYNNAFSNINFLAMRTDFGLEYKFAKINKFSTSFVIGTSLLQIYPYLKTNHDERYWINEETIRKDEKRKNIYPYAMLKFNYQFKDKLNIGLFVKTNYYYEAQFMRDIESQDVRFSSGVEVKF